MSYPLVLIEWEDSCQPSSAWKFLDDLPAPLVTTCRTVGWLLSHKEGVAVVAQTIGLSGGDGQCCGRMYIPTRAIVKVTTLRGKRRDGRLF